MNKIFLILFFIASCKPVNDYSKFSRTDDICKNKYRQSLYNEFIKKNKIDDTVFFIEYSIYSNEEIGRRILITFIYINNKAFDTVYVIDSKGKKCDKIISHSILNYLDFYSENNEKIINLYYNNKVEELILYLNTDKNWSDSENLIQINIFQKNKDKIIEFKKSFNGYF